MEQQDKLFLCHIFWNIVEILACCGLHCNYYSKIVGGTVDSDVSIKFNTYDFQYMQTPFPSGAENGYIADMFCIIIQQVETGQQPDPTLWKIIDFTSQIPNHTVGDLIDPANLRGTRFIITSDEYYNADMYDLTEFLPVYFDIRKCCSHSAAVLK